MKALAIIVSIIAAISGLIFATLIGEAENAVQECAVAAFCMAIAVIPYVFLRGIEISIAAAGKPTSTEAP